jgi:hypothetical protein
MKGPTSVGSIALDLCGLTAPCFVFAAVLITIDAVAAALRRPPYERAGDAASYSTHRRASPTVGDCTADDCSGSGADCRASFGWRARCKH